MIEQMAELNRVLMITREISPDAKAVYIDDILDGCKQVTFDSRMPDHKRSVEFSIEIGLLQPKGKKRVLLTGAGEDFLDLKRGRNYDLSPRQKQYLIRSLFFDGPVKDEVRACLMAFAFSEKRQLYCWSSLDGEPFGANITTIQNMEHLGLLQEQAGNYIVTRAYNDTVRDFIQRPKGYTEEQLFAWLEEKKKLGNTAEELILDFERGRLRTGGHLVESKCVKHISKGNTNAGYDIESFNGKAKGMQFDRFIEVKGSGNPKLRFVWTTNEMKVAEKLGDRYWIYYQGGINRTTGKSAFKPILIQNPFKKIPNDIQFVQVSNGVVIESHIQGAAIKHS